jgi:hypothetical protein
VTTEQWEWTARHPVAASIVISAVAGSYRTFVAGWPATVLETVRIVALLLLPVVLAVITVRRARTLSDDVALEALRGSVTTAVVVAIAVLFLTR